MKYSIIGTVILTPALFAYFYGPKSELTLLARLHYNTLFVYTPCLGRQETYDDGAVKFSYRRPPALLSHTAVLFLDPTYHQTSEPFADATEAVSLEIPTGYAYKFKLPSKPALPAPASRVKLKKGMGEIRNGEPSFKDYGPQHLYLSGKTGYTYKIALPFYLERTVNRTWIFPALYHSGILSRLMPGSFTDYLPPRGFLNWFFTPCADKQMYCSGKVMLESIEVAD